ncbi:MAG: hypothetical protein KUG79_00465 [Pseudomonadales bacterium]|nr:hypothetical protein [Pseudomonadales bacterium]
MHITFVKKILANGQPCQKCADVAKRLLDSGQMSQISETVIADERDPNSVGMQLAKQHNVSRAPFFIVYEDNKKDSAAKIYTVYFKFAKEILGRESSKSEQNKEILNDNPDLDFI